MNLTMQATSRDPELAKAKWEAIAEQDVEYHLRQFKDPYRSTVSLGQFLSSHVGSLQGEALDVACGAGANIFYLSQLFPKLSWTGVDLAGAYLFPHTRKLFAQHETSPNLLAGDFYRLTELLPEKKYDLVLSTQTLHTLPSYEQAMEQLLAVTSKWLVITSLFTHFRVDAKIETTDYTWPAEVSRAYYSVYSLPRLREFCESHGAKEVITTDFNIDLDLSPPANMGLGTYTRMLDCGERLQFTGPVYMPWKFVLIRMS
jgi:ubiquinone/menaquinone biosynthesis C-methylase UbiE